VAKYLERGKREFRERVYLLGGVRWEVGGRR
jgi:hypothetical protein